MRSKALKPEIGAPGLPSWVKYVGFAVFALAASVGGIVALVVYGSTKSDAPPFVLPDEIPDGFFVSFQDPEQAQELPPPPPPPPAEPEPVKAKPKGVVRVISVDAPPEPKPITLVTPNTAPKEDPAIVRAREQFNAQRRASGGDVRVYRQGSFEKVQYEAKDRDWKRYGVPQEDASFPRDMSRLITQDRTFRAVLINEIASDLSGQVVAQIEQPVYGAHGRNVLVPAGSRAIGYYEPLNRIGEERLAVFWTRIITPEGINITLENGQGVDQMGRSGLGGNLDRRYSERYGITLLFSILSTAMQLGIPSDTSSDRLVINNWARETSDISSMILEDHLDIKPRLSIPAGTRILIQPTKDIYFREPIRKVVQVTDAEQRS